MSTVTDFMHSSLPSPPPTFPQLTSVRMETEAKATSVFTEMTGGPTLGSEATTTTLLGDSTTVTAHSTDDISSTATTESTDTKFTITNIATTVPATARSLSPSTIPSALTLSTLPSTTSDGQPQEPTTDSKPPEMTSPSPSTSQWLSTPDGKEGLTTFEGAPDGTATPTTPPLTDVFLQPTSQVSTSPTRVTIQPITEPQDPITPNKVSFVCDEVDRTLSVVECATPNECTINIFVCDGVSDCSDGSDESLATCLGGMFLTNL
nr:mucin-2-like [Lytechinus pictus]